MRIRSLHRSKSPKKGNLITVHYAANPSHVTRAVFWWCLNKPFSTQPSAHITFHMLDVTATCVAPT